MIPKIAHFVWLGSPLPAFFKESIAIFISLHPDWEINIWDYIPEYVDSNVMARIDQMTNPASKSALLRWWMLHQYGGVSISADVRFLRNIDELLMVESFAGRAQRNAELSASVVGVSSHCQASEFLLNKALKIAESNPQPSQLGKELMADLHNRHRSWIECYPEHYFSPFRLPAFAEAFLNSDETARKVRYYQMRNRLKDGREPYAVHIGRLKEEKARPVFIPHPPTVWTSAAVGMEFDQQMEKENAPFLEKGPSLARKAINLTGALARATSLFVRGKSALVSMEERDKRLEICTGGLITPRCEFFDGKSCLKCGCTMKKKTWLTAEKCPIGRW